MVDIGKIGQSIKKVKTPFYLYDRAVIKKRYKELRDNMPRELEIFYAAKANPNKDIVEYLGKLGAGCDIASSGELRLALMAGIRPDRISFAGPGKTREELELAVGKRIASISVENPGETVILDKLSKRAKKKTNVSVRVNPASGSSRGAVRMGGGSQQFGIDEEMVPGVIRNIKKSAYLNFIGLHVHTASQILSEKAIADNIAYFLDYCAKIQDTVGVKVRFINFGGGLGIPYYKGQKALDMEILGGMIRDIFYGKHSVLKFDDARFIFEPGRFLVGESGTYVVTILYKKRSNGKTFLIVDGGMHQNLAACGLLGGGFKRNNIIGVFSKKESARQEIVTITGCLCTPLDIFARDIRLPVCEAGDHLYITCSGAYGYSASPLLFLSHPIPGEVIF